VPEPLQAIADDAFLALEHPLQPRRFALALFFALILFPLIAVGLAAGTIVLIVPLFAFLFWMSARVLFANYLCNCILVSELNYPRIHGIGEELKAAIGFDKTVNIFVYEQGNFNAYLIKFFFYRRAVFLNSELLEAGVTDDELRWLIGRFIGYLRARKQAGFWGWTIRAAQYLLVFSPFLLPYERALVYTGDRIALAVIHGDISSAISAMQKLFVGRQLGYSVNPNGIVDQRRLVKGSFFAFLARLGMAFPHMTTRYVDLIEFAKERFPAQFERFEAENPGLPADLRELAALPKANVARRPRRDPVWASLIGAVVVVGVPSVLITRAVIKQYFPVHDTQISPTELSASTTAPPPPPPPPPPMPKSNPETSTAEGDAFVSTAGRFSVLFPGAPTQDSSRVTLSGSDSVILHQFHLADGGTTYLVIYNDYPAKYVAAEPQAILESIRDASAEKATLISDEAIDLNGVPGRAFKFTDKDGMTYVTRDFLDGQRLYQVMVTVGANSTATPEDFLDSFRIQ
jgi:hypothetical protein